MQAKHIGFLLILIIVAVIALFVFRGGAGQDPAGGAGGAGMPPPEVSIVTVSPGLVAFTKDLPGRVSAYRVAEIRPQVGGIITKRLFEEGSEVEEGQQLYQIDAAPYQAAYDSSRADLMRAQANVKSIQARAARFEELVKIGGISKQEYDDARAGLAQARAGVAIANAALAQAKINLDYTKVFSPISGRIGQSSVTEGALVTASQPQALATVQQFDQIYVDVTQSGEEIMELRRQYAQAGQGTEKPQARLVLGGKEVGEPGELQFSDVTVNPGTGTVQLRILFPNASLEVLPGLFVHARLVQSRAPDAILIPQQSVIRNPDGSIIVWLVGAENKVAPQPVTLGEAVGDQWHVLSGLKAGDRIVVEGTMKVQPGAVVNPVERGSEGAGQPPSSPSASPQQPSSAGDMGAAPEDAQAAEQQGGPQPIPFEDPETTGGEALENHGEAHMPFSEEEEAAAPVIELPSMAAPGDAVGENAEDGSGGEGTQEQQFEEEAEEATGPPASILRSN
ncbi:MAG: efflux RND transporter periplasmic adaptor subunit [Micavibrio sp.]